MNHALRNIEIIEDQHYQGIHPKKFLVWLFIVTIVMLFAALTSAYIVKQSDGNWLYFELPDIFWITSLIIVISSITMQLAVVAARKDNIAQVRMFLISTTVLGFAFLAGQYKSWGDLVLQDVFFVGNPSGSFLYVLTGVHAVHIISGIIFLLLVLWAAFNYKVHSKRMLRIGMCATYWHFLGGLWLYLFFFLKINH
jgi:cytochrome c oxidase subunit 3